MTVLKKCLIQPDNNSMFCCANLPGRSTLFLILSTAALFLTVAIIALSIVVLFFPSTEELPIPESPFFLVWEYSDGKIDLTDIGPLGPVEVVSPTWFKISDQSGTIINRIEEDYIIWAKERGYRIWPLVSNSFDPQITAAILTDPSIRHAVAEELVTLAQKHEFDGLNIDFENFHSDYRDHFSLFVSELADKCREAGLVLSVDVTMISGSEYWSLGYDRLALAAEADYVILMAYDEHWKGSPTAGSVASLPWVERGLKQVLLEVPPEKLILGVPFYTRLWEIDESGEYPIVLNSRSLSMPRAYEIIAEHDAEIYWDHDTGQHVARYRKSNLTYMIWLEDRDSMRSRLALVEKYGLAGAAGWRRGLELDEIWDVLSSFFRKQR